MPGVERSRLAGVLATLAPASALLHVWLRATSLLSAPASELATRGAAALVAAGFVVSALVLVRRSWAGRGLATASALAAMAITIPVVLDRPAVGLGLLLAGGVFLTGVWPLRRRIQQAREAGAEERWRAAARGAAITSLVAWSLDAVMALGAPAERQLALALTTFVPFVLGVAWAVKGPFAAVTSSPDSEMSAANQPDHAPTRSAEKRAVLRLLGAGHALTLAALVADFSGMLASTLIACAPASVVAATAGRGGAAADANDGEGVVDHPARVLVLTFLALGFGGGTLLWFPWASADGSGIRFIDAVFTAVSASCVTGLSVVDTEFAFSTAGHVVIMLLIQVGGLGIMTFSTAAFVLLGRRMSVRYEGTAVALIGAESRDQVSRELGRVFAVTFGVEAVGAAILTLEFWRLGDSFGQAVWRGMFTAVSAFCNAGFALQSTNLVPYQTSPVVLHTVGALIIFGGLGPAVVLALPVLMRRRGRTPLAARLAFVVSVALLVLPAGIFAALEWNHSLSHLSVMDRLHNAWFTSVTPRTAGFNSIDYTALTPASVMLTMGLMFVGGSPGSTAGGVKTTTIAVLVAAVVAVMRGGTEAEAFGRRIPHEVVYRATAILSLFFVLIGVAFGALLITQDMPFDMALFEVISALGTVGLTVGATPRLDDVGKLIIIACMFAGRVGPLTLFLLLVERERHDRYALPSEQVAVG